jgi:hypothetical protein
MPSPLRSWIATEKDQSPEQDARRAKLVVAAELALGPTRVGDHQVWNAIAVHIGDSDRFGAVGPSAVEHGRLECPVAIAEQHGHLAVSIAGVWPRLLAVVCHDQVQLPVAS